MRKCDVRACVIIGIIIIITIKLYKVTLLLSVGYTYCISMTMSTNNRRQSIEDNFVLVFTSITLEGISKKCPPVCTYILTFTVTDSKSSCNSHQSGVVLKTVSWCLYSGLGPVTVSYSSNQGSDWGDVPYVMLMCVFSPLDSYRCHRPDAFFFFYINECIVSS